LSALAPVREPTDILVRLEYLTWDTARLASQGRSNLEEVARLLHRARVVLQEALFGDESIGAESPSCGDQRYRRVQQ
jgi:hypothetical protein